MAEDFQDIFLVENHDEIALEKKDMERITYWQSRCKSLKQG